MLDRLIYFEPITDDKRVNIEDPEQYVRDNVRYMDESIIEQLVRREWVDYEEITLGGNNHHYKQKLINFFKPYFKISEIQDGILKIEMNRYKYLRFAAHLLDLDEEVLLMRKLALKQSANSLSTQSWLYDEKITNLLDKSKLEEYEKLHNPFQAVLLNVEDSQTYNLLELIESQVEAGVSTFYVFTGIYAQLYD